jgi:predicted phosphodiesterase
MRVCCISDTHASHHEVIVPECDLLIHAGDLTADAGRAALRDFVRWFEKQPAKHKVFIAGNHDWAFEKWPDLAKLLVKEEGPSCIYLQDSGVEIEGFKIWGSPVTPRFYDWAFNRDRGADIQRHWDLIPKDTNILITHGPPFGILDKVRERGRPSQGCANLADTIKTLPNLKLHCFGHLHLNYDGFECRNGTMFVNASQVNENYIIATKPKIINIEL